MSSLRLDPKRHQAMVSKKEWLVRSGMSKRPL